jgi:hypothetical protein
MLGRVASEAAQKHLPGSGWCFFDVRHEFPDAWQLLRSSPKEKERGAKLHLRMDRKMFPFVPRASELSITSMAILFHTREHDECDHSSDRPKIGDCPCPQEGRPASRVLEFTHGPQHRHDDMMRVSCVTSEEWPDLYYGLFDTHIEPLGRNGQGQEMEFRFPVDIGEVERIFLLCQYQRS